MASSTRSFRLRSVLSSDSSDLEPKRASNSAGQPQLTRRKDKTRVPSSAPSPIPSTQLPIPSTPSVQPPLPDSPRPTTANAAEGPTVTPPQRDFFTRKGDREKSRSRPSSPQDNDSDADAEVEYDSNIPGPFSSDVHDELKIQASHIGELHEKMDQRIMEITNINHHLQKCNQSINQLAREFDTLRLNVNNRHSKSNPSVELCGMITTQGRPCRKSKARCPYRRGGMHPPQPSGHEDEDTATSSSQDSTS